MSLFPLSSPVDALREYFSRMDIEMIDLILDDKNTYNQLKKEVFLEKLDSVFDAFKAAGDTRLNIFRGECGNCFKRCQGYTFSGNNSSNYLDLLIKEKNGEIFDIFYCSELVNYCEIEKTEPYALNFEPDEAADFVPDEDYLILVHKSEQAMLEWTEFRNSIISQEAIELWLSRYKELYEDCVGYFMYSGHSRFFGFYHDLNTIQGILSQYRKINREINAFRELMKNKDSKERELILWLMRNEDNGLSFTGEISSFVHGSKFERGRILLDKDLDVYLAESEYKIFFEYEISFSEHYHKKLKEYSIFSLEEIDDMEPETEEFQKAGSLKFHIEQRQRSGFSL